MQALFKRIGLGLTRHPWRFLVEAFLAYSVCWTLIEPVTYFFPALEYRGSGKYILLIGASLTVGLCRAITPYRITIKLRHTNTAVDIEFGDLFSAAGCRVIPVNEFFDSLLGEHVSPSSLHGYLLSHYFGGHTESFDAAVIRSLANSPYEEVDRASGNRRRYPLGTTAVVLVNNDRYLLVALTRTDLKTLKASAGVPELWSALSGLWQGARVHSNGQPVCLPLLGSGLAGVGLPPSQLLELVLISLAQETKREHVANYFKIVLAPRLLDEVDLRHVRERWS